MPEARPPKLIICLLAASIVWGLSVFAAAQSSVKSSPIDGSIVTIRIDGLAPNKADEASDSAFRAASRVHASISHLMRGSEFHSLNQKAGKEPTTLSADNLALVQKAFEIYEATDGAYDPTVLSVIAGAYNFLGKNSGAPPDEKRVKSLLPLVGLSKTVFDADTKTYYLPEKGMRFDPSALLRGKLLETVKNSLAASGVESFAASLNGNLILGKGAEGKSWNIGLEDSRRRGKKVACIKLEETAIFTSGDYERFFIHKGKRYHDKLDPKTGLPVEELRSVTVIAQDAATSSALSAAFMVAGLKATLEYCEKHKGIEAVITDKEGRIHLTAGIKEKFELGGCAQPYIKAY